MSATITGTARTLPRWRCAAWTFVPLATTTCTKGSLDSLRVILSGGTYYAYSSARRTWVRTAYAWSTPHKRLEIDARLLSVPQPAAGRGVSVWRWTCTSWTIASDTGPTTCTRGSARRVVALFGASGTAARILDGTTHTYIASPYRWNTHGGYLALDARLVPAASVTLGATMQPVASTTVRDFVVRCPAGTATASVVARAGASVTFDGVTRTISGPVTFSITAGQSVHWTLTLPGHSPVAQQARCLPDDFPTYTSARTGTPTSQWYLVTPNLGAADSATKYVVMSDTNGTPVWWMGTSAYTPIDARMLPSGEVGWSEQGFTFSFINQFHRSSWSGVEAPTIGAGLGLDHHELLPTSDGNYIGIRYVPRNCPQIPAECVDMTFAGGSTAATIIDGELVKFSPDGLPLWVWKARDHVAFAEWTGLTAPAHQGLARLNINGHDNWDIDHINSVEEDGDGYLVSFRHDDAVYRIRSSDGSIDWKLGGTPTVDSLAVLGLDRFPLTLSQHDARRMTNGHVSVFDNGSEAGRAPRVLEIAVDPATRTATVVRQVSDPRVPASSCCGSSREVPGGGLLTAWGGTGWITETGPTGAPVLSMDFTGGFSYRAVPVALGVVARSSLVDGMDVMHPRPA